jgi:hypothetical protein
MVDDKFKITHDGANMVIELSTRDPATQMLRDAALGEKEMPKYATHVDPNGVTVLQLHNYLQEQWRGDD